MGEKTLKFGDTVVNKKEFHTSKQAIALSLVDTDEIISDKYYHSDNGSKYSTDYLDDDDNNIIRRLYIILPQIRGYIKYFDDGGKNKSFKIEDDNVSLPYIEIWNKIRRVSNSRFHCQPIYDSKYIKTKVRILNGVINTLSSDNKIPKGKSHYICISAICIDSILKTDK